MKKNILIVLFILIGMNVMAQSVYDGKREAIRKGSGTESDPFLIENAQNLAWLQYMINADYSHETSGKYYLLTTDIDLNGSEYFQWEPIGKGSGRLNFDNQKLMFKGIFDGDYHKITNLYIDNINGHSSFFEDISGVVKNLYIEGYVNGNNAAGLVEFLEDKDAKIEMCVVNVEVEGVNVAGVVNTINNGIVSKTANIGNTKGDNAAGIAYYSQGNINNCYNTGTVETVNSDGYAGGIATNLLKSSSVISNSYNIGEIISINETHSGGIAGRSGNGVTIDNCYYLNTCINNSNEYGTAMTADDMRKIEFVNILNKDGIIWAMDTENVNDGYPIINGSNFISVKEKQIENETVIYPNPATEYVCFSEEITSCDIFDLVGNKIFSSHNNSSEPNRINVSNWNTGIYFVKIKTKNGINVINKLVVQ